MTDSLVSTRGRRANAGSRLKQLIELEEQRQDTPQVYIGEGEDDENVRLLFQEDGEDDEFVDEDIDNENLQGIDESEEEDDDNNDNDNDDNENDDESRKRTHDEVNDDDVLSDSDLSSSDTDEEEGEKELERQEKLKKRKMRKTVVPAIKMPSAAPKRSRPTVLVSSDSLTSSDRRSSSRRSALQNKNALIAKLQEDEERSKLNKPVVRPVEHIELTQEERLAAAVETERLNVLALNEFRQQEIVKKEKQRLMHALRRHQLVDVVRFLSRVEYVTPLEELAVVRKKLEKERSRKKGGRKKKNPQEELLEQIKKKMWLPGDVDEDLPYVQEEFRLEDEKKEREGREEKDEKEETEGKEGKDEKEDKEETEGKEVHEENGVEEKENEEKIEEKDKEYEEQVNEENEEKMESLEGKENEKENGNEVNQKVGQENEQMKEINDEVNESNIEVDKNNEEQTVNDTEIKSEPVDSTVPNDPAPTTEANGTSDKTEVNNTNGTNEVNGTNDTNDKTEVPNPTSDKGHTPLPGTSSPSNTPTRTRSESRVVKAEPETEDSPGPEEPAKPVYVPRIKYNSTDTFAGPPQKVTRNNVLLVDFETYLDRTTVRKVVLGSQSVLGSSRRFKDLKPVIRIGQKGYANSMAGPEPVDEIFELAANLDESDKIFDDLKRLPRLGAQQVEDDLVEDDEQLKEMPIVIATEAPTSLYLQNNNKKACLISGKEVRYFDPSTGIPYDSVETYRVLKDIEQGIVPWYSLSEELDDLGPVELYYGNRNGVRHAKGVPEGFA